MILSKIHLPQHTIESTYNTVTSQSSAGIHYKECKIALDSFGKYVYSIAVGTHFFHTILRISAHYLTQQWAGYRYTVKYLR
jgi:hypothetical protein